MPTLAKMEYMDKLKANQLLGGEKEAPKIENCTQVEERYYLQYQPDRVAGYWFSYRKFYNGFKTEKSALSALNEARRLNNNLPSLRVRIIKQTRTIEIKTTTEIEVLNEN